MIKRATPDHPVHEVIAKRWSPYAFADREVSDEDLFSLFEAPPRGPEGVDITPHTRTLSENELVLPMLPTPAPAELPSSTPSKGNARRPRRRRRR